MVSFAGSSGIDRGQRNDQGGEPGGGYHRLFVDWNKIIRENFSELLPKWVMIKDFKLFR